MVEPHQCLGAAHAECAIASPRKVGLVLAPACRARAAPSRRATRPEHTTARTAHVDVRPVDSTAATRIAPASLAHGPSMAIAATAAAMAARRHESHIGTHTTHAHTHTHNTRELTPVTQNTACSPTTMVCVCAMAMMVPHTVRAVRYMCVRTEGATIDAAGRRAALEV